MLSFHSLIFMTLLINFVCSFDESLLELPDKATYERNQGLHTRYDCRFRLLVLVYPINLLWVSESNCYMSERIESRNGTFETALHTPGRTIFYNNRTV